MKVLKKATLKGEVGPQCIRTYRKGSEVDFGDRVALGTTRVRPSVRPRENGLLAPAHALALIVLFVSGA